MFRFVVALALLAPVMGLAGGQDEATRIRNLQLYEALERHGEAVRTLVESPVPLVNPHVGDMFCYYADMQDLVDSTLHPGWGGGLSDCEASRGQLAVITRVISNTQAEALVPLKKRFGWGW